MVCYTLSTENVAKKTKLQTSFRERRTRYVLLIANIRAYIYIRMNVYVKNETVYRVRCDHKEFWITRRVAFEKSMYIARIIATWVLVVVWYKQYNAILEVANLSN